MKDNKLNATEQKILTEMFWVKTRFIFCIILALTFILWHSLYLVLNPSLANWRWAGIYWFVWLIMSFFMLLIWRSIYKSYTLKIYKILIESKSRNLPAKNVSKRLWLIPYVNMYKPYTILRDVYEYANVEVWKKDETLLYTRRISILTPFLWSFVYSFIWSLIDNDFSTVLGFSLVAIIFYIPLFWILSLPITIKLRKLYKLYQENQKEN